MLLATEVFVPVTHQTAAAGENNDLGNSVVNQLLGWQLCSESIIRLAIDRGEAAIPFRDIDLRFLGVS